MVLPVAYRVVVVAVFAAVGGLHLLRCLSASVPLVGSGVERVNDLVHLLMGVEMVAMTWGGPLRDRWNVQLTVFAIAIGWFAVQATGVLSAEFVMADAGNRPRTHCPVTRAPRSGRIVSGRGACAQHAIIAGIMTWMIAAMPVAGGPVATRTTADMSAMAMPAATVGEHAVMSPFLGVLLGGYLLLSAPWWLVAATRTYRRRPSPPPRRAGGPGLSVQRLAAGRTAGTISHAVMAAAMGAVLLVVQ